MLFQPPQGMSNGPQHPIMGPQGPPSGPTGTAGPGGEIPPNTQQPMPMTGFNQGQNMGQGGYRGGPVMPGQGPAINRTCYYLKLAMKL